MPTFDELLARHEKDIRREINRHKNQKQTQIPRKKNNSRPWDTQLPHHELLDPSSSLTKATNISLFTRYKKQGFFAVLTWLALLIPTHVGITFIPKNYYSTLYLYAPEKTDSISSRLTLFYNRIEFASFPMELKIPISILSKKLRQDDSQAWVVKTFFERFPGESVLLNPTSVRVETGYITTSEILVVEGFANSPELASKITSLYGEYFNLLLKKISEEHFSKIELWFVETDQNIDRQIKEILEQLGPISGQVNTVEINTLLNSRANENAQNIETKRLTLTLAREELLKASTALDLSEIQGISDPDIQSLLKIYNELSLGPDNLFYSQRAIEVETQIKSLIEAKLKEKNQQLKALNNDRFVVDQQKNQNSSAFMKLSVAKQKESSLLVQLNVLRTEKSDLQKLKSQLDLDLSMHNSKTRVLQKPTPNEGSVRPQPAVYHATGFVLITILIVILFGSVEIISHLRKKDKN